jgi:hypothetical protein
MASRGEAGPLVKIVGMEQAPNLLLVGVDGSMSVMVEKELRHKADLSGRPASTDGTFSRSIVYEE